ncbi:MAG: hypothetical protein U1F11_00995 [Steroidobacteraceae bacterium]
MPSGELVVLPDGRRVQSKLYGPNALRALCSMPLREDEIPLQVLPADYLLDDPAVFPVLNAESLLWQSALFSARGRLPEGTPLDEPVVMRCWPNMTRMALFPHAMRIAAVWADGPRSLLETARLLRIPQRHVFAFYSAAHALGYAQAGSGAAAGEPAVQRAAGQATGSGPARAARPERTSLFQRILERLRLGAVT